MFYLFFWVEDNFVAHGEPYSSLELAKEDIDCLTDRYGHFCCGFVQDSNGDVVYEF